MLAHQAVSMTPETRQSKIWDLAERNLLNMKTKNIFGQDVGYYLIGDGDYPLQSWLIKTFKDNGHLDENQQKFNKIVSRACCVVESAFRRLKARCCCLFKRNDCRVGKNNYMVMSCILHNLCERHGEPFSEEWNDEMRDNKANLDLNCH